MELNLDWGNLGTAAIVLLLVGFLVLLAVSNIRIVPQAHANVVERLGAYKTTWQVGLHFKIPLIDRIAHKISLKEHVTDFPPQPVITPVRPCRIMKPLLSSQQETIDGRKNS